MKAFTLDLEVISALEQLRDSPPDCPHLQLIKRILYGERRTENEEVLDDDDMFPSDYEEMYAQLRPEPKPHPTMNAVAAKLWKTKRLPNLKALYAAGFAEGPVFYATFHSEVKQRQRANKRRLTRCVPGEPLNASRITEAIISLGLEALQERVARLGSAGSKRKNVGESQDKLPYTGRRKKVAVSAVRGES
jgi:hypothetical protein